jgi:hypothetical protein
VTFCHMPFCWTNQPYNPLPSPGFPQPITHCILLENFR